MELWRITQQAGTQSIDYLKAIIQSGLGGHASAIDSDRLALLILQECGNMRPIYNSYSVFYTMSINWFASRYEQITHLINALLEDYLPYEEFNWHEHEVLDGLKKTDDTRTIDRDEMINNTGSYNNTGHSDDATETGISADNESTFQPREHVGRTVDDTLDNSHTDSTSDDVDTSDVLDGKVKTDNTTDRDFYGHKTSNQLLAKQELEIAQENIYDCIVKWFTDALFVGVWE